MHSTLLSLCLTRQLICLGHDRKSPQGDPVKCWPFPRPGVLPGRISHQSPGGGGWVGGLILEKQISTCLLPATP